MANSYFLQGVVQGFRAKYSEALKRKALIIILESRNNLRETGVLPKALRSLKSVVEYLGRYTHKITRSNHRLQSINDRNF
jgi:hypothetical protein